VRRREPHKLLANNPHHYSGEKKKRKEENINVISVEQAKIWVFERETEDFFETDI